MKRTLTAACATLCLLAGIAAPMQSAGTLAAHGSTTQAAPFEVDMAHSTLLYKIRHLEVTDFYGRVNMPEGSFLLDAENPSASSLEVTVQIKNMDAGNRSRDQFLLSPDFFNAREYPESTFKGKTFTQNDDGSWTVLGDFTMRNVTREVEVTLKNYAENDTEKFGYRAGFEAIFAVNRSDYGMSTHHDSLGEEVKIIAAIEGVRR